ncbi:MAG: FtsQ-type POTRA domain-containing protein, partial [Trueperaceae bacterium]
LLAASLLASLALVAVSRFVPTVERIEVVGAQHHDRASLLRVARVAPGDPLLWITRWRVAGLNMDPWVRRARVIRHWPDTVVLTVWEREPAARASGEADAVAWAWDGTVLPNVPEPVMASLPIVRGWGRDRTDEAMDLLEVLRDRGPLVIEYAPEGFEIALPDGTVFTPDLAALQRQWAAVESHRGGRIAVYPWGVSKAHE